MKNLPSFVKFVNCFVFQAFQEMISAYFNDFATIDSGIVCAWLFKLEGELR